MIGKTLGHYRVLEKLGAGGMGVVYKAHDLHLDRLVALKILPPEKVADPERKQRFTQEAKSASSLSHPGIITIHDIASSDGVDFIAMEYVEGKTSISGRARPSFCLMQQKFSGGSSRIPVSHVEALKLLQFIGLRAAVSPL